MPISLRSAGFHSARKGWSEHNLGKRRHNCGFFWINDGEAEITIGERTRCHGEAGMFFYYYLFEAHRLQAVSTEFSYYWLTFDGMVAEEVLREFQFPPEGARAGAPPRELFLEIQDSLKDLSVAARYRESALLYQILTRAATYKPINPENPIGQVLPLLEQFREIVQAEYMNNGLNLKTIARRLHCHRTTLVRLLKNQLSMAPSAYIQNVRLDHALRLLDETNFTAAEISELCGFSTPEYFSRRIKQKTGSPPHRFRNRK